MNFNLQPFLENDMVKLRPLKESDFAELFSIASDSLIWIQHQNADRHTKENFTEFFNEAINSKGALVVIDVKSGALIGSSRFKLINKTKKVVEIGWSFLARTYWGGAYNRAFKGLMVNFALKHFDYVVFYVNVKNFRSQKAMEKLGAKRMMSNEETWVLPRDKGVTYVIDSPLKD